MLLADGEAQAPSCGIEELSNRAYCKGVCRDIFVECSNTREYRCEMDPFIDFVAQDDESIFDTNVAD